MNIEEILKEAVSQAIETLYNAQFAAANVRVDITRKEFEGDYTILTFPFARLAGKKPQDVAEDLGNYLSTQNRMVRGYNVVKGFCNLSIDDAYWTEFLPQILQNDQFGQLAKKNQTVVVEYSSPNTNKPLHLGHIRNNLLGYAASEILGAAGYDVKKVQIINDRGIHICKSMLAWQKFGNGETPASTGMKGDHLVGKYYVQFEAAFQKEYAEWKKTEAAQAAFDTWASDEKNIKKTDKLLAKQKKKAIEAAKKAIKKAEESIVEAKKVIKEAELITESPQDTEHGNSITGQASQTVTEAKVAIEEAEVVIQNANSSTTEEALNEKYNYTNHFFKSVFKNNYFNQHSAIGQEAKTMLQKWENGDEEVNYLWKTMNSWVYDGFKSTYERLGVDFDKLYYESNTYLLGKDVVEQGLKGETPIFYKQDDGSTWIDLSDAKLDKKAVLRKDGTSMYITQDIGTASLRYQDFQMDKMVYVVGNEQEYHFKVLFEILKRLGHDFAKNCYHLSYGMVNLTTGKMKSREGTVVDADDLMQGLFDTVKEESKEHQESTIGHVSDEEQSDIWEKIAAAALKFYILKVEPHKGMTFDPKQSIDLQGQTGPYIQNAYVRTQAVQRKLAKTEIALAPYTEYTLRTSEKDILQMIHNYPNVLNSAAESYNPAEIANYLYALAKGYHKFWNDVAILDKNDPAAAQFRVDLSKAVAKTLKTAGALLGIGMPQRM